VLLRIFMAIVLWSATFASAGAVQIDSAAVPACRPLSAEPVERAAGWPAGHYFRVVFAGLASDNIIVNGYRADVVVLDNAASGQHFAIARLPSDAAVTHGFITFMVMAKTALGYTTAVPLKIVLE
jgi:hypothetical protein